MNKAEITGTIMEKEIINKTVIKTKGLYKDYNMGKSSVNVLNNIDLEVYEGDFTVIMGSSGSGKSTLLYSLSSMDTPTNGKIELLGLDITNINEKSISDIRKKYISFIFQSINLINDLTAFENITYPAYMVLPKAEANRRAERLLQEFGLAEQRNKYPNEMSGGQQQRIAIIRAIVSNPKILFADEPTGALNSKAGTQVLDLMTLLNEKGQSIVMVTHDVKACVRGNRLLFLADGQVDGVLNLGRYNPAERQQREEAVFEFLKKHQW